MSYLFTNYLEIFRQNIFSNSLGFKKYFCDFRSNPQKPIKNFLIEIKYKKC